MHVILEENNERHRRSVLFPPCSHFSDLYLFIFSFFFPL